jgi:hypothetical protein
VLSNIDEMPPKVKMRRRLVMAGDAAEGSVLRLAISDSDRKIPPR